MQKDLNVDKNLVDLAKIFKDAGHTLYIVGGFVRNALLGFCETDIDVCSAATPAEVEKLLEGSGYKSVLINPDLGTLHIKNSDETIEYEHTTFRAESYAVGGEHSPANVRFVTDMRLDASRRDFSANALYYDILGREIVDFYDGVECVTHHVLKTVETPDFVFGRDGLRILRMARIASELAFEIDSDTFESARANAPQLGDISQERFNREIVAMIFADNKYQSIINFGMQSRGVKILGSLGAWQYVLADFWARLSSIQQDGLNNAEWDMLSIAPPALRVSSMLIDIFEAIGAEPDFDLVQSILGVRGVMLNKKEVARQQKIVSAFYNIKNGDLRTDKLMRLFLQANSEILSELFGLCKLAGIAQNVMKTHSLMRTDNVPFTLRQLAINGDDIKNYFPDIPPRNIGQILGFLLNTCALMPEINTQGKLIELVATMANKFG